MLAARRPSKPRFTARPPKTSGSVKRNGEAAISPPFRLSPSEHRSMSVMVFANYCIDLPILQREA